MSTKQVLEPEKKQTSPADEETTVIDTSRMSKGKREALEVAESARESNWNYPTFVGQLFLGKLPWDIIYPYPAQPDDERAKGEVFLDQLEAFLKDKVDADQIHREGEIPDEVLEGLARIGAMGIKIPTEYGGLGLSQADYCRAAILFGSHCGNISALLSAHQSIGVPQPLLMFGTEAQKKKYLPRVATGEISAFALTEDSAGSDPAKMETTAEPTEDGEHFILNGEKLWCTNGVKAGALVVMSRTPSKMVKGKERRQITAFIVETDWPGVTVERRCYFMGLKALYNGVMKFENVKVPRENIILAEGKGLRVALSTLNTGRLSLPAICTGTSKACLKIARDWSNEREQWGAKIGRHAAIADKIAKMAAYTFAMESMTQLSAALVDEKKTDIRLEAAVCKMFATEEGWRILDETMQIRGGRGYETSDSLRARGERPVPIERMMRDSRINLIFEGSSEIMRLFIAREALDPHLKLGGAAMNGKLPTSTRIQAGLRAARFYALWYPRLWFPRSMRATRSMDPLLRRHARHAQRTSRKLARSLFHAMVRHGASLEAKQILLKRLVDIGADIFAMAASCSRAQMMLERGDSRDAILPTIDFFCREARHRIADNFKGIGRNNDGKGYSLAEQVLDGNCTWLEEGIVPQSYYDTE